MANTSDEQPQMGIWEHVEELRARLLKALIALVLGVLAGFAVTERIIFGCAADWRLKPHRSRCREHRVFCELPLQRVHLAFPIIFYRDGLVLPGLEKKRRWLLPPIPLPR